jgi:hypothetical protein
MLVKESTPTFHERVARYLTEDTSSGWSQYLQCFGVVDGYRNKISRIMFRKDGLRDYLKACRDPENPLYVGDNAEASLCCTRLSMILLEKMAEYNHVKRKGKNPIPFGSKIWVKDSLGLYFTLGNQDLETFFKKGEEIKAQETARLLDGNDHGGRD